MKRRARYLSILSICILSALFTVTGALAAKKNVDPRVFIYDLYSFNGLGYEQTFDPIRKRFLILLPVSII
jgi:hypothetical protein